MEKRIKIDEIAPGAYKAMLALEDYLATTQLTKKHKELIKVRASQVNGCAFCIDMHTKDARASGETEQRLYLLSAWREANCYSARERAALAWTEAVTRLEHQDVPDPGYEVARSQFHEEE